MDGNTTDVGTMTEIMDGTVTEIAKNLMTGIEEGTVTENAENVMTEIMENMVIKTVVSTKNGIK